MKMIRDLSILFLTCLACIAAAGFIMKFYWNVFMWGWGLL